MWIDNEEQDKNQGVIDSSNPSIGTGGAGPQAGGITSNPSTLNPVQTNQPVQKFATVQDYLGANKTQGEDLGNKFTNKLGDTATQEKNTISGAANKALGDINAGTTAYNSSLVNKALAYPTQITNSPDQLTSFLNQWNAAYKGPESFESTSEYGDAAKAANEASAKQAQIKSAGGQQQLIQDEFGVYGQGNKGLDQALLQNSSAFPQVQQQAKEFGTIGDYLQSNATNVGTAAQAAKAATEATKQQTQNAFANNLTGFQTDLNTRTEAARQEAEKKGTAIQDALKTGDATKIAGVLKSSGVDAATAKSITDYLTALNTKTKFTKDVLAQNPDLSGQYQSAANTAINPANVASKQDYENANAYKQLTGVDYSGVLNPADISQAGTAGSIQPGNINTGNVQEYLKNQLSSKDKSVLENPKLIDIFKNKPSNRNYTIDELKNNDTGFMSQIERDDIRLIVDAAKRTGATTWNGYKINDLESVLTQAGTNPDSSRTNKLPSMPTPGTVRSS